MGRGWSHGFTEKDAKSSVCPTGVAVECFSSPGSVVSRLSGRAAVVLSGCGLGGVIRWPSVFYIQLLNSCFSRCYPGPTRPQLPPTPSFSSILTDKPTNHCYFSPSDLFFFFTPAGFEILPRQAAADHMSWPFIVTGNESFTHHFSTAGSCLFLFIFVNVCSFASGLWLAACLPAS